MCHVAEWSPIAYKKPTVQSPKATDGADSKAVDGILRTRHEDCTVVGPAKDPWWSVDLGKIYNVDEVAITTAESQTGTSVIINIQAYVVRLYQRRFCYGPVTLKSMGFRTFLDNILTFLLGSSWALERFVMIQECSGNS